MDTLIQALPGTTFANKRFTRKQLASIQSTVMSYPKLSQRELGHTICEHLNWTTPNGKHCIQACLKALNEMQDAGLFKLPQKNTTTTRKQKTILWSDQSAPQTEIQGDLSQFASIKIQKVTEKQDIALWNEYVERYHYLGYKRPIGTHLRYFIIAEKDNGQSQRLGCLLFSFAVPDLACRNQWIGWDKKAEKKRLHLILNNNRLLIFPWINVKNLISKTFSLVTRHIAQDWKEQHGFRPVLLETFVDPEKYTGSGYRAANWVGVGKTAGKKGSMRCKGVSQKDVYLYPLDANFRDKLIQSEKTGQKKRKRIKKPVARIKSTLKPDDPFILLWQQILHIVFEVASSYDQQWQIRSRLINTILLMLFIFRLVFSKNKQGYEVTSVELWEQCRLMGITVPQEKPISGAAFSKARKKLDPSVFKVLNNKIIQAYTREENNDLWKGHRLFAVDGSKINLPRQLLNAPYKKPCDNAHYPQGLLSTLYQLKSKIPYDFGLSADANERTLALSHLKTVCANDLITYDRGYFSYAMLYYHIQSKVQAVFRLQKNSGKDITAFFESQDTDRFVSIEVSSARQSEILSRYPDIVFKPIQLRLVKYTYDETTYVLGTTLLDTAQYSIKELSHLYHARWGIEELYKVSKVLMEADDFHGLTDQGVRQELYAHFVLITLNRIFANHTEQQINSTRHKRGDSGSPQIRINMKNSLLTMARHIEALFLKQAGWITEGINHMVDAIGFCKQKVRPGRKYERKSMKPAKKWKPCTS